MARRITGLVFISLAALLYATRFIVAAIFGQGVASWNADLFRGMLQYVDQGLTPAWVIALVVGLVYLLWAEIQALRGAGSAI